MSENTEEGEQFMARLLAGTGSSVTAQGALDDTLQQIESAERRVSNLEKLETRRHVTRYSKAAARLALMEVSVKNNHIRATQKAQTHAEKSARGSLLWQMVREYKAGALQNFNSLPKKLQRAINRLSRDSSLNTVTTEVYPASPTSKLKPFSVDLRRRPE